MREYTTSNMKREPDWGESDALPGAHGRDKPELAKPSRMPENQVFRSTSAALPTRLGAAGKSETMAPNRATRPTKTMGHL